mmetsp:Transcript_19071/g.39724  ORF Transcript_19071/g.39724 Transcript_19071/m.39724 type:complete len:401 (+) Transcript_19071:201-1403(+)
MSSPSSLVSAIVAFVAVLLIRVQFPAVHIDLNALSFWSLLASSTSAPPVVYPCSERHNYQYDVEDEGRATGLHLLCVLSSTITTAYLHTLEKNAVNISDYSVLPMDRSQDLLHKYSIFTPGLEKVYTEGDDTAPSLLPGLYLLFEGGMFMWPGVRKGFTRKHPSLPMTIRTLSVTPLVLEVVEDFISPREISLIRTLSEPHMKNSGVSLMDKDKGKAATQWRTSSTYFLGTKSHEMLRKVDERVSTLTNIPLSHSEQIQVLRYGPTQKYDGHHDYFDPSMYQNDRGTMNLIGRRGERNRLATVFFYLSDVESGGETMFFREGGRGQPRNLADCSDGNGMKVFPRAGKVIIFYSLGFGGDRDEFSLHGGCPVGSGIKWSGNKWLWNAPLSMSEYARLEHRD